MKKMETVNFEKDWRFVVKTAFQAVKDAVVFGVAINAGNILMMGVCIIGLCVRLYICVTLSFGYWRISKLEEENNFMLYHRDSFAERIRRHHIYM